MDIFGRCDSNYAAAMLNILGTVLVFALLASFICIAVHNVMVAEGMLLSKAGEWLDVNAPFWLCQITFSCLPCMASFWGISLWLGAAVFFPFWDISLYLTILLTPSFVLVLSGLNTMADALYQLINSAE